MYIFFFCSLRLKYSNNTVPTKSRPPSETVEFIVLVRCTAIIFGFGNKRFLIVVASWKLIEKYIYRKM
jgi:hypothetical protein